MRTATPSVIVPFIADQPFWGARLHEAGLTPAPIRQRAFSAASLGRALDDAEKYRARVADVAGSVSTENGTATALSVLTTLP